MTNDRRSRAIILNNIGITFRDQNKFDEALSYFNKALKENPKENLDVSSMLTDNIAYTDFLTKKKNNVLSRLKIAFKIRDSIQNKRGIIVSKLHLGHFYLRKKDSIKSLEFLNSSLTLSKEIKDDKNALKALMLLSDHFPDRNYLRKYVHLRDSIYNVERDYKHTFAAIRLRTKMKENELSSLLEKYDNQSSKLEREEFKNTIYLFLFIGTFLVLIITFYFFRQRRKILNQRIIIEKLKVKAEEKQKLSIYLHDDVAGDILLGLQQGEKLKSEINHPEFSKIISFFDRAYEKARKFSQDLSQLYFHKIGFDEKILNLCTEYSFHESLKITCDGLKNVEWEKISNPIKVSVFEAIRESLNNILKHADASEVVISFYTRKKHIHIGISDNGKGIDLKKKYKGIGFLNMRKSISDIGGTLNFKSSNSGTHIEISIPILYE